MSRASYLYNNLNLFITFRIVDVFDLFIKRKIDVRVFLFFLGPLEGRWLRFDIFRHFRFQREMATEEQLDYAKPHLKGFRYRV